MLHETLQSHGHTLDVLTHPSGNLRIQVSRRGAELVSLVHRGAGYLWRDGDLSPHPGGWNNHCTVMGYYIHRILNGQSVYEGKMIRGGTHSFLRHVDFAAPEVADGGLIYRLSADSFPAESYPRKVDFTLGYFLDEKGLKVVFRFDNREETASLVSFGLHPGFAVRSLSEARLILPPGLYRRLVAPGNFLSGEIEEIDFGGGPMPFEKAGLPDSFLLELKDVPERTFLLEDLAGRRVTLDYADVPYLTLWSNGENFLCVEPCWGLPDHQVQRPFEQKEGLETIRAGGHLERSFRIIPG